MADKSFTLDDIEKLLDTKIGTKFDELQTSITSLETRLETKIDSNTSSLKTKLNLHGECIDIIWKHVSLGDLEMPKLTDDAEEEKKTEEKEDDGTKKVKENSFTQNTYIPGIISHILQHKEQIEGFLNTPKKPINVSINFDEDEKFEDTEEQKLKDCWTGFVESFFKFMEVPDSSKVKLVAYKLKGGAAAWWETLCEDRDKYDKPPKRTWKRMRELLRAKFLPKDYKQQLFIKLKNCQQGAKLVEEYVVVFYGLVARNQLKETEEKFVARFIDALNNLIQQGMTQSAFTMVEFRGDKCNKCNQTGHTSSDCRKFHVYINEIQEETQVEEELGDDEFNYLQEHETYDADFLGAIRPVLIIEPCPTQRHSIFKSHCLIEKKLCNMIIDSGSTENYVSAQLVEKLGLPVITHPNPYSVGWINISSAQQITHQCFLKFSFPGYEDYALCDVINMTAASLLLGRPWKYDISVVHNCYDNTYTFVHEGFTKVLWPL
ncbi:uncharacterized protein LOC113315844 [Papaver somniferum]|uniref:uncharacterized protein LOC113315844 n=1 Tax=Papaver somniferum TaxID=3469 RepID=UPI000E7021AD|nr:uncharacterized protein LOC113315844 [Papaver somniferum]